MEVSCRSFQLLALRVCPISLNHLRCRVGRAERGPTRALRRPRPCGWVSLRSTHLPVTVGRRLVGQTLSHAGSRGKPVGFCVGWLIAESVIAESFLPKCKNRGVNVLVDRRARVRAETGIGLGSMLPQRREPCNEDEDQHRAVRRRRSRRPIGPTPSSPRRTRHEPISGRVRESSVGAVGTVTATGAGVVGRLFTSPVVSHLAGAVAS